MKNKIIKIGFIFTLPLILSACELNFSTVTTSSSTNTTTNSDSSSSTTTSSSSSSSSTSSSTSTSSLDEPDQLMIFENTLPLSNQKGGFNTTNLQNTEIPQLKYNYKDYYSHNYYDNVDSAPSTGDLNVLVVPVAFADTDINVNEETRKDIYNAYFGTPEDTGFESVASYFYKTSYGNLRMSGVVTPWYETNVRSSISTEFQVADLCDRALEWYKETFNSNAKEFDKDSNGLIDIICLIYNVNDSYNGNDNLWAYTYWDDGEKNVDSPNVCTFFWASVSFMYETQHIEIDAHTYIHEMGHALGLDDYYNYDSYSSESVSGGFMMQSYNVGDHDPYSKIALGWVSPLLVTGSTTVTLSSFAETGQVIILKPDNNMDSPFDEYIMIDLYTPTNLNKFDSENKLANGYPQGPKSVGIRIWHIDARLVDFSSYYDYEITTEIGENSSIYHGASNSTGYSHGAFVSEFTDFRLLHLLEADNNFDFKNGEFFSADDMWYEGDSFSLSLYRKFFVNGSKMNNNQYLPYTVKVDSIENNQATLSISLN